jgi:hypothetical protein
MESSLHFAAEIVQMNDFDPSVVVAGRRSSHTGVHIPFPETYECVT